MASIYLFNSHLIIFLYIIYFYWDHLNYYVISISFPLNDTVTWDTFNANCEVLTRIAGFRRCFDNTRICRHYLTCIDNTKLTLLVSWQLWFLWISISSKGHRRYHLRHCSKSTKRSFRKINEPYTLQIFFSPSLNENNRTRLRMVEIYVH